MRTNLIAFVSGSENRKKIVQTIFEYPKRPWSCSSLEEMTKIPHATVFRTLQGLHHFGILKAAKINKKDFLYELVVESPLVKELERIMNIERITSKDIARKFADKIKSKPVYSIILYGSSVSGEIKPESDIDVLIILKKKDKQAEQRINDLAAELSSRFNKTIAPVIIDEAGIKREKSSNFIKSIKENNEVLYGKTAF